MSAHPEPLAATVGMRKIAPSNQSSKKFAKCRGSASAEAVSVEGLIQSCGSAGLRRTQFRSEARYAARRFRSVLTRHSNRHYAQLTLGFRADRADQQDRRINHRAKPRYNQPSTRLAKEPGHQNPRIDSCPWLGRIYRFGRVFASGTTRPPRPGLGPFGNRSRDRRRCSCPRLNRGSPPAARRPRKVTIRRLLRIHDDAGNVCTRPGP